MKHDEDCRCDEVILLWDDAAQNYARHLTEVQIRDEGWATLYECARTKWLWLEDRPMSESHGGGPVRLCKLWRAPQAGP